MRVGTRVRRSSLAGVMVARLRTAGDGALTYSRRCGRFSWPYPLPRTELESFRLECGEGISHKAFEA